MAHFCFALHDCTDKDRQKIAIAAAFHDLGIWSDGTIDYLPPSMKRVEDYLSHIGLDRWSEEIGSMLVEHHKLRAVKDSRYPLVEVFRKADLVDVSLGMVKSGVPGAFVRSVKAQFPNQGFHKTLMRLAAGWFARHPGSPPPFMKW